MGEITMTVREAFSKAFGEVPEGATCHIGAIYHDYDNSVYTGATLQCAGKVYCFGYWKADEFALDEPMSALWEPFGPDISDRDAHAFRGFFGDKYDGVLDEVQP